MCPFPPIASIPTHTHVTHFVKSHPQRNRNRRNRLNAESVEADELLHYWIGSGIVKEISTRIAMEEVAEAEVNGFVEADNSEALEMIWMKYSLNFRFFNDLILVMNLVTIRHKYKRWIIIKSMKFNGLGIFAFLRE